MRIPVTGQGAPPAVRADDAVVSVQKGLETFGYNYPADMTSTALLVGVGNIFFPTELPSDIDRMPDVGQATKRLFGQTIRPALEKARRASPQTIHELAIQVGRMTGVLITRSRLGLSMPFSIVGESLSADGVNVPVHFGEKPKVIDFGVGLSGLVAHAQRLRKGTYRLVAVQQNETVSAASAGVLEALGVPRQNVELCSEGMGPAAKRLSLGETPTEADLVIASRVHMAGVELQTAIAATPLLLREGGVLLARGPVKYAAGYDYAKVLAQIQKARALQVLRSKVQTITTSKGSRQTVSTIVAQKNR